ncbi:hypothetical protein C8039_13490 [Halogeometricum sp. wsp3]|nr:hypothetical protein C8039_13490 [Halogeometricum sp. wsp3]
MVEESDAGIDGAVAVPSTSSVTRYPSRPSVRVTAAVRSVMRLTYQAVYLWIASGHPVEIPSPR